MKLLFTYLILYCCINVSISDDFSSDIESNIPFLGTWEGERNAQSINHKVIINFSLNSISFERLWINDIKEIDNISYYRLLNGNKDEFLVLLPKNEDIFILRLKNDGSLWFKTRSNRSMDSPLILKKIKNTPNN